jgi:hypothetical protein
MSGGGSDVEGAPDFYYQHLVGAGEQEMDLAGEFMNFYKYGTFDGAPRNLESIQSQGRDAMSLDDLAWKSGSAPYGGDGANEFGIDWSRADFDFESTGLDMPTIYNHPTERGKATNDPKEAQQWLDAYNKENGYQVYLTQDGKEFRDYEEAAEYSYQQGFEERPASYATMEQAQIASNMELIPLQTEAEKLRLQQEKDILEQRAPALRQYFAEAGNVDPNSWANRAQADVAQQFGAARDQMGANIARTGAVPGAGRMGAIQSDLATRQAKATAGARTTARRAGEQERFNRLGQAIQMSNQL